MTALRVLVTEPADLTSTDAFVGTGHSCGPSSSAAARHAGQVRHRLCRPARSARAPTTRRCRRCCGGQPSRRGRRAASRRAGAAVRYRRLRSAITELHALAMQSDDDRLTHFLSTDATVLAMMAAAVDVVEAAGLRWTAATTRPHICAAPCTGGATAGVLSTRCTAAAAPTSQGVAASARAGAGDARSGSRGGRGGGGGRSGAEFTGCGEPRCGARHGPVAGGRHQPDRRAAGAACPSTTFVEADELGPPTPPPRWCSWCRRSPR